MVSSPEKERRGREERSRQRGRQVWTVERRKGRGAP
jgi:hypothetical protein